MNERDTILILGDTSCDVLIRAPLPGSRRSDPPELIAGGTAGNTAMALARLGLHSKLLTELGDDYYGRYVSNLLIEAGVDTERVHIFPGYATTQVIILLDDSGSPAADWPVGDSRLFDLIQPQDIDLPLIANAAWIHTSGTSVMFPNTRNVLLHTLELAVQARVPLSFDINLRLHGEVESNAGLRAVRKIIREARVVFGSDWEWRYLEPGASAAAAARKLLTGPEQTGVIRAGPAGSTGIRGDETLFAPAFRVSVRDALGAGDVYDAGFILAQMEGLSLAESLRWGNAAAALKLMQAGDHRGGPTRRGLEVFLESRPG